MTNKLKIRGVDQRVEFVKQHKIIPIFRRKLSSFEERNCICSNPVKNEIFFLQAISKLQDHTYDLILGSHCASHILKLADEGYPPLFDPFKTLSKNSDGESEKSGKTKTDKNSLNFCPLNQEMYNAIGIVCESWNIDFPNGDLLNILQYLTENPEKPSQEWAVLKLNGIIGKDGEHRRLVNMLSDLRQEGKELKYFTFDNMNSIISNSGQPNHIENIA